MMLNYNEGKGGSEKKLKVAFKNSMIGPRQSEENLANFPVALLNISFLKLLKIKNYLTISDALSNT